MAIADITTRLTSQVALDEVPELLREARNVIIELRLLLNDTICAHCGGAGHSAAKCPWKREGKNDD